MKASTMRMLALGVLAATAAACRGGDKANTDTTALATDSSATATTPAPAPATPAAPAMTDPNIVAAIGTSNAAEIAAGEAAQRKATNAQVKAFAGDMVKDHRAMQKMSDSLTKANAQLAAQPAPAADSAQQATKAASDSLNAAPKGAQLDQMYMAQQVAAHQKVLNDLNNFSTMAQDASLKTMIQGAIPKVQQHLDRARQIQSSLGTTGGGTAAAGDTSRTAPGATKTP